MSPVLIGIIVLVVLLIGIGLFVALRGGSTESRAITKGWGEVATRIKLRFTPPADNLSEATLTGTYRQREVAMSIRVHAMIGATGDRRSVIRTDARAFVNNKLRHYIRFSRKGEYRKTDRFLGTPLQPVGDPELDRRFDIKGIPPNIAKRVLATSDEFRQRLLALGANEYIEIEVEGTQVHFEQGKLITTSAEVMAVLDFLNSFASAVENTI